VDAESHPNLAKQGPTVTPMAALRGVTFHVTDRSGVASQCIYSPEFRKQLRIAGQRLLDLSAPAIRLFENRTGFERGVALGPPALAPKEGESR
jgi:hypothetical protein